MQKFYKVCAQLVQSLGLDKEQEEILHSFFDSNFIMVHSQAAFPDGALEDAVDPMGMMEANRKYCLSSLGRELERYATETKLEHHPLINHTTNRISVIIFKGGR